MEESRSPHVYYAKRGILAKKGMGKFYRPWSIRYFILEVNQSLSYFSGKDLRGTLTLNGATVEEISSDEADGRPFAFKITDFNMPAKKCLILSASSADERAEWVKCLQAAVKSDLRARTLEGPSYESFGGAARSADVTDSPKKKEPKKESHLYDAPQSSNSFCHSQESTGDTIATFAFGSPNNVAYSGVVVDKNLSSGRYFKRRYVWIDFHKKTLNWSKNIKVTDVHSEANYKALALNTVISCEFTDVPADSPDSLLAGDKETLQLAITFQAAEDKPALFTVRNHAFSPYESHVDNPRDSAILKFREYSQALEFRDTINYLLRCINC